MAQIVINNLGFLKSLSRASRYRRLYLLALASPDEIQCLRQCCLNVSNKTVPLKQNEIKRLIKGGYKKYLFAGASRQDDLEDIKKILIRHGGFLTHIIPAVLRHVKKFAMMPSTCGKTKCQKGTNDAKLRKRKKPMWENCDPDDDVDESIDDDTEMDDDHSITDTGGTDSTDTEESADDDANSEIVEDE